MVYDVAVVGLGAMGSAVLAHCAARGAEVIGLEQFGHRHELGSSAGKSRLIRKAYFENEAYVPLLLRAYELWRKLEADTGEQLLRITGLLMVGSEDSEIITGSRAAAAKHELPLQCLDAREIKRRYPQLVVHENEVAAFEPGGGVLAPERANDAHLRFAAAHRATIAFETAVQHWDATNDKCRLELSDGRRIAAKTIVLTLGPWFAETFDALGIQLRIQRNVQAWFAPASDDYQATRFPAFLVDRPELPAPLYGVPDLGDGVKAAFHGRGLFTNPTSINREIAFSEDVQPLVDAMEQWMPGSTPDYLDAKACMYSLTPDHHFVVDRHPNHRNVILCGGFSGHGFKFAPVIGEIAADLSFGGESRYDISFLALERFR